MILAAVAPHFGESWPKRVGQIGIGRQSFCTFMSVTMVAPANAARLYVLGYPATGTLDARSPRM